jgi:hypothetical protein
MNAVSLAHLLEAFHDGVCQRLDAGADRISSWNTWRATVVAAVPAVAGAALALAACGGYAEDLSARPGTTPTGPGDSKANSMVYDRTQVCAVGFMKDNAPWHAVFTRLASGRMAVSGTLYDRAAHQKNGNKGELTVPFQPFELTAAEQAKLDELIATLPSGACVDPPDRPIGKCYYSCPDLVRVTLGDRTETNVDCCVNAQVRSDPSFDQAMHQFLTFVDGLNYGRAP